MYQTVENSVVCYDDCMFTGIVRGIGEVVAVKHQPDLLRYAIRFPALLVHGLEVGASVAIDGVCQTVVLIAGTVVTFDAIAETLTRTTICLLEVGSRVNLERSARLGDEVGGHVVAGHVYGTVRVESVTGEGSTSIWRFSCEPDWIKYLFSKGFVALNGCSLTLVEVDPQGSFTVHLIPETLRQSTFGGKGVGDLINLEFDPLTVIAVDTVERVLARK